MYTEGYVPPVFSIAIERASSENAAPGGQLAIGGLPPVEYKSDFANAPFQLLTVTDAFAPTPISTYQFYIIITNGFTYAESDNTTGYVFSQIAYSSSLLHAVSRPSIAVHESQC